MASDVSCLDLDRLGAVGWNPSLSWEPLLILTPAPGVNTEGLLRDLDPGPSCGVWRKRRSRASEVLLLLLVNLLGTN